MLYLPAGKAIRFIFAGGKAQNMKFGEKLRILRKEKKINQEKLGELLGVTKRTVQNYEKSDMYPKKKEIYYKLAEIFDVNVNYFLTEDEEAPQLKNDNDINELTKVICGLFAGGKLPESDMDAAMRAITEAYFAVKDENSIRIKK